MTAYYSESFSHVYTNGCFDQTSYFDQEKASRVFAKWLDSASGEESCSTFRVDILRTVAVVNVEQVGQMASKESTLAHSSTAESRALVVKAMLCAVYSLDARGESRQAARSLMKSIEDFMHVSSFDIVNRFLLDADVPRLSSRSLIGLIRSTARAQAKLPAWKKAYAASRTAVSKQGKDANALFVGLPVEM